MREVAALVVCAVLAASLLGCDATGTDQVARLSARVDSLEQELAGTAAVVTVLQRRLNRASSAELDPAAQQGYALLEGSIGTFAVSPHDVSPYADGTRLVLDVGNLTSATVPGGTLVVKWGERRPEVGEDFAEQYREWQASLQQTAVDFTEKLLPGFWNKVVVTLPRTTPSELGYMEVSLFTDEISLNKKE